MMTELNTFLIWLFLTFTLSRGSEQVDCKNKEIRTMTMKLKSDLLCGYDKYVRPVLHHSNKTSVKLMVAPRIINFDEAQSLIRMKTWISMSWTDSLLSWDKLQYDDIDQIGLDTNMVWVPDLHVYNSMEDLSLDQVYSPIIVDYKGSVYSFMSPALSGHCNPNWMNWPFDVHSCTFTLGSKRYMGSTVDFDFFNEDMGLYMKYFLPGNDWQILSTNASRDETKYGGKNDTNKVYLVTLNYNFIIKRHSSVYMATFLVPGLVMVILSLGLLWIPSDKVERLAVLCTLVIIQSLYLQYVGWKIPANGDKTPYIVCFYRDCMLLTGLLVIQTLVTRSILSWNSSPNYLQSILQIVGRNKVLQFIFVNEMDPKSAAKLMESGNDEGSALVPSDENEQKWRMFVSIINKSFFILLLPIYFLLSVRLMPFK